MAVWNLNAHMKASRGLLVVGYRGVGKKTQLLEAGPPH